MNPQTPPLRVLFEVVIHVAGGGAVPSVLVATPLEGSAMQTPALAAPVPAPPAVNDAWDKVVADYCAYGNLCGGRRGKPWSPAHAAQVALQLAWWRERLGITALRQLKRTDVERELAAYAKRFAPATVHGRLVALKGLLRYALDQDLLERDPLKALRKLHKESRRKRRALRPEEVRRLLLAAPPNRSLVYEVVLHTALRRNEVRSLLLSDLDPERRGLHLRSAWTKNREDGFAPLPKDLWARVLEQAERMKAQAKKPTKSGQPRRAAERLFRISRWTAKLVRKDLANAGIEEKTGEGIVDFHSLRKTAITLFEHAGANSTQTRRFGRHKDETTSSLYREAWSDDLLRVQDRMREEIWGRNRLAGQAGNPDSSGLRGAGIPDAPKKEAAASGAAAKGWLPRNDSNVDTQIQSADGNVVRVQVLAPAQVASSSVSGLGVPEATKALAAALGEVNGLYVSAPPHVQTAVLTLLRAAVGSAAPVPVPSKVVEPASPVAPVPEGSA